MQSLVRYVRRHHVAFLALFVALGGTSYAAVKLPANSVGPKQLKANAVTAAKVKNGSLQTADFAPGQLPAGAPGAPGAPGPKGDQGVPGAPGAPGESFVPDLVDVSTASANDSQSPKQVTATCPPGMLAVGGYRLLAPGDAPLVVDTNREDHPGSSSSWVVGVHETAAYDQNWMVVVFAVCVG